MPAARQPTANRTPAYAPGDEPAATASSTHPASIAAGCVDELGADFCQTLGRIGRLHQCLGGVDARRYGFAAQPEQSLDTEGDAEGGQRSLPVRVDEVAVQAARFPSWARSFDVDPDLE